MEERSKTRKREIAMVWRWHIRWILDK